MTYGLKQPLTAVGPGGIRMVSALDTNSPFVRKTSPPAPEVTIYMLVRMRVSSSPASGGCSFIASANHGVVLSFGDASGLKVLINFAGPGYTSGNNNYFSPVQTVAVGSLQLLACRASPRRREGWRNGVLLGANTTVVAAPTENNLSYGFGGNGNGLDGLTPGAPSANNYDIITAGIWTRWITDAELAALSANPWLPYYRPSLDMSAYLDLPPLVHPRASPLRP